MGFGFNWAPPSVLVDVIGRDETITQMERYDLKVPEVLKTASADTQFFNEAHVDIGRFFAG